MKKVFIQTHGCQMNEYDSNRIYDAVKKIGYEKTNPIPTATLFLSIDSNIVAQCKASNGPRIIPGLTNAL